MTGKCPHCASVKPVEIELSEDRAGAPLCARCGHCRRVLGVFGDPAPILAAIESLRAEVAELRKLVAK